VNHRFVDCRWDLTDSSRGRALYRAGHIPGAAFLDVDADLSDLSV
jgi:3-mercaptopyruvate sulfurtransferase SseA